MKTYTLKKEEVRKKRWVLLDAQDVVLGRLASFIAHLLRGKDRPDFTPHVDCGACIVVINAAHVHLTGFKKEKKKYYRHTGYVGGIKSCTARQIFDSSDPCRVLSYAVKRMLPRTPLGRVQFASLRIYPAQTHIHGAQNPEVVDFKSANTKNVKRNLSHAI